MRYLPELVMLHDYAVIVVVLDVVEEADTVLGGKYGVKSVYPSQKDCVWMLLQNGGGICDHEVGTGRPSSCAWLRMR